MGVPFSSGILTIFGITGDLSQRKLLPALYHLAKDGLLPENFLIVGVTRQQKTPDEVLAGLRRQIEASGEKCEQAVLARLTGMVSMIRMDITKPEHYADLKRELDRREARMGSCMHRLFYLAIPAQTYQPVVRLLGEAGLNQDCHHGTGESRILVEKPFGYDVASARELIEALGRHFREEQIYRIDHYLAKETVQNILNFRFQNPIFKLGWNRHSISRIVITAAEELGIEGRAVFYEQTGALRDLIQSHLMQLLVLTTMEEPATLTAADIHRSKTALLEQIVPIPPNKVQTEAVRGQYEGYRGEVDNPRSVTETYAALRLEINNDRWRGVPMLLRTGKALPRKVIEIIVVFSHHRQQAQDNLLTLRIQPGEGISLRLLAKKPGFAAEVEPVEMSFDYRSSFGGEDGHPDAYERVLVDAFAGDKSLFTTGREVMLSWQILEAVVQEWQKSGEGLEGYAKGSWGPAAADRLAARAQTDWSGRSLG